jgi:hypothetical protein
MGLILREEARCEGRRVIDELIHSEEVDNNEFRSFIPQICLYDHTDVMYRPAKVVGIVDSIQFAPSPDHEDLMKDLAKTEQLRISAVHSS